MKEKFVLDFVIIGAQKCGTSALADYLSRHPEVNFCKTKEPSFFSHKYKDQNDLEKYYSYFDLKTTGIKGEASTSYSNPVYLPNTAEKLKHNFPKLKIIFVVRNPIRRIESHINHAKLNNREVSLNNQPKFVERSMYGHVLYDYSNYFSLDQILILKFEDLVNNRNLNKVSEFLNISFIDNVKIKEINKTNLRFHNLRIWNYYKKHWSLFQLFKVPKSFKLMFKQALNKLLSKQMVKTEYYKLNSDEENNIISELKDDSVIFEKITGIKYFELYK